MNQKVKTAVVTDSNSGYSPKETSINRVYVVPMPFSIDGETYYEGVNLSQEQFYEKMLVGADIKTSMPAVTDLQNVWEEALKEYEEVIYLPMSGALSSGYQMAVMLAQQYNGKVQVVDSCRVSVPQKRLVMDARELASIGKSAAEIKEILSVAAMESVVFIAVDTLKYLKKGGRITPATAAIGSILRIKPILRMQGGKLDIYKTARTMKSARAIMMEALKKECEENFHTSENEMRFEVAYSGLDDKNAKAELMELKEHYPNQEILMEPLTLSLSCHIGPNAVGVACTKKVSIED